MKVTIRIPTPLRRFTKGSDVVAVDATTVGDALEALEHQHPGIGSRILEGTALRTFVNIYVRDEDIRVLDDLRTEVRSGDVIAIVPAISGG